MVYKWAQNYHSSADPAKVAAELEEIRRRSAGVIVTEVVLEEARNETTELHLCFEWQDDLAAEKFRMIQARTVVNSLRVVMEDASDNQEPARIYINVPSSDATHTNHYVLRQEAVCREETRGFVIARAVQELQNWTQKYGDLEEFAEITQILQRLCTEEVIPAAEAEAVTVEAVPARARRKAA